MSAHAAMVRGGEQVLEAAGEEQGAMLAHTLFFAEEEGASEMRRRVLGESFSAGLFGRGSEVSKGLLEEGKQLLDSLPEEKLEELTSTLLSSDSALACLFRSQILQESQRAMEENVQELVAELRLAGEQLLRRAPEGILIAILAAVLEGRGIVSSQIRQLFQGSSVEEAAAGLLVAGGAFSVKYNLCTVDGLKPTLGVTAGGEGNRARQAIPLDQQQADLLSSRMEESGKKFVVEAHDWQPLDDCEHVVRLESKRRNRIKSELPKTGEIDHEQWVMYEFNAGDDWTAFEVVCEGSQGLLVIQREEIREDMKQDRNFEREVLDLEERLRAKEEEIEREQETNSTKVLQLQREAAAMNKKLEALINSRTKSLCLLFSNATELKRVVIRNKSARANAIQRPIFLEGCQFSGRWYIGLKSSLNAYKLMTFRLSVRFSRDVSMYEIQVEMSSKSKVDVSEQDRQRMESEKKAIAAKDMHALQRIRWEKWNKVDLARGLQSLYVSKWYHPECHTAVVHCQRLVRGFLGRRLLRWLRSVAVRRGEVKKKDEDMRSRLSFSDKKLLTRFSSTPVFQELDDARYAEAAAMMLKYGNLENLGEVTHAARAIFNVVDVDGSGEMDVKELGTGLSMLGLDDVPEEQVQQVLNHFDADGSGSIDKEEFVSMVAVLCSSQGGSVKKALKKLSTGVKRDLKVQRREIKHEASQVAVRDMTNTQLDNMLERLRVRVRCRDEEKAEQEAELRRKEEERKEQERAAEIYLEERRKLRVLEENMRQAREDERVRQERRALVATFTDVNVALSSLLNQHSKNSSHDASIAILFQELCEPAAPPPQPTVTKQGLRRAADSMGLSISAFTLDNLFRVFAGGGQDGLSMSEFRVMVETLVLSTQTDVADSRFNE